MNNLIFQQSPTVHVASNIFINVRTVIMFEDTPLLQVEAVPKAGYTTKYSIYHSDGTFLAKVVGSQLYSTKEGEKAGVKLRHDPGLTVCEMGSQTLFEIRRVDPAALKTQAELHTPLGTFIKATDQGLDLFEKMNTQGALKLGNLFVSNSTFNNCDVGIRIRKDGKIGLCVNM